MNFKDWEKVSEDSKTVTMKHPKGHSMTIALSGLPKIMREQLMRIKMAEGGKVSGTSEQGKDVRRAKKMKEEGDPDHEKWGEIAKDEAKGRAAEERFVKPKMKGLARGGEVKHYDEGAAPVSQDSSDDSSSPDPTHTTNVIVNAQPQPSIGAQLTPQVAPQAAQAPPSLRAPTAEPEAPPPQAQGGDPLAQQAKQTLDANAQAQQGYKEKGEAEGAQAQALLPAAEENTKKLQNIADLQQRYTEQFAQEGNDLLEDMKKGVVVNPKNYQENMGSGQKVSTAIGLMLGGLGTPFGGTNYAYDFLNKQIDRDIQAQKDTFGQQKSLYSFYMDRYNNEMAATKLASATLNDIYSSKIQQEALRVGTPLAMAKAKIDTAALANNSAQARTDAAGILANSTVNGGSAGGAQEGDKKEHPLQGNILSPSAAQAFKGAQFSPYLKDKMGALQGQYKNALQADKALNSVNDTFNNLINLSNEGGISGRIHRGINPHAVAAVTGGIGAAAGAPLFGVGALPAGAAGTAIGEALGHGVQGMTNTTTNRGFDSEQSSLKGYISSALKGTNVGGDAIDDIVSKNSPEYGDSDRELAHKLKTIREFIQNHTDTDLLELANMTNKKTKTKR